MKTKVNLSHTIRVVTAVSLLMSQGLDDVVGVAVHAKMQSTENLIEANTLDSADGLQTNDSNTEAELVLEQQLESNDNMMSDVQVMLSESVEQTKLDSSLSEDTVLNDETSHESKSVYIEMPDPVLRAEINKKFLSQAEDAPITPEQMETITYYVSTATGISDLTGMEHATNLGTFQISNGSVSDVSPLQNLTKLQSLAISNMKLTSESLNIINKFSTLRSLTLSGNTLLKDVSLLVNMRSLETLIIRNCGLTEIPSLSNLTKLKFLDFNDNEITDINFLSGMLGVETLNFSNNKVSDISVLGQGAFRYRLKVVNAMNNRITNVSPLHALTGNPDIFLQNQIVTLESVWGDIGNITLNNLFVWQPGVPMVPTIEGNGSYDSETNTITFTNLEEYAQVAYNVLHLDTATKFYYSASVVQPIQNNLAPVITGVVDVTLKIAELEDFDLHEGVVVSDDFDTDITYTVTGEIAIPAPGQTLESVIAYRATDSRGQTTTIERKITVTNELPVITGADDVSVYTNDSFDLFEGVVATDVEDGDLTHTIVATINGEVVTSVDTSTADTLVITYTVIDSDGNKTVVTRQIVIAPNELPVIDVSKTVYQVGETFNPLQFVTASDLEDGDVTDSLKVVTHNVDTSSAGVYHVTYLATDSRGEQTEETVKIIVRNPVLLVGADDVTISIGDVDSFDLLKDVVVDADYVSEFNITYTNEILKPDAGEDVESVIVYTVTDSDGLTSTHERTITVTNRLPEIHGVADRVVNQYEKIDLLEGIFASDLEDGDLTASLNVTVEPLSNRQHLIEVTEAGEYLVTYAITDSDGNKTTATSILTVTVNDYPTIQATDQLLFVGDDFDPLEVVSATDIQDGDLTDNIQIIENTVDMTVADIYQVTYSVTDSTGCVTTKTIHVKVVDHPLFEGVTDKEIPVGSVDTFDPMEDVTVNVDDDIDYKVTVNNTISKPAPGQDETFELEYVIEYDDDKTITVNREITVTNRLPEISKPADITITKHSSLTEAELLKDILATDYEDGDLTDLITIISNSVNTAVIGSYEVKYSVVDSDGNVTTETRRVSVVAETNNDSNHASSAPNLEVEDQTVQLGDEFDPFDSVTATDSEGNDITHRVEILENNVDTSKPGSYEVTYSVTDDEGNTTVKTITVTIPGPTTGLNAEVSVFGILLLAVGTYFSTKKRQNNKKNS